MGVESNPIFTAETPHRPVLAIMGPTAAGKTDLAVALTQRFPCAIISVDSAMVYRSMDIGTAKPNADTLAKAPHRLIDILDPSETYSAAQFRSDALAEINAIHSTGQIPLLVGGTMLYFRALEQGLSPLPTADPAVRARLEQERLLLGNRKLHQRLSKIDPEAAQRIHPNDPQRVQRALEVYELSGTPLSKLQHQRTENLPFRLCKLALIPGVRSVLHQRIERRFQHMLAQGFIDEVQQLRARADLSLDKPAMRCSRLSPRCGSILMAYMTIQPWLTVA